MVSTSVGVLVGTPAIALAVAATDQCLLAAERGSRRRFAAAGLLFGLALQTKLFVVLALPAIALAPLNQCRTRADLRRSAIDLLIFLAAAAGCILRPRCPVQNPPLFPTRPPPRRCRDGNGSRRRWRIQDRPLVVEAGVLRSDRSSRRRGLRAPPSTRRRDPDRLAGCRRRSADRASPFLGPSCTLADGADRVAHRAGAPPRAAPATETGGFLGIRGADSGRRGP